MKRIISLLLIISLLVIPTFSLSSCELASELLGVGTDKPEIELEGVYDCVAYKPMTLEFSGDKISVRAGRKSLDGTFEVVLEDGQHSIIFDFGNSNSFINGIGTGKQPLDEGNSRGIDYIMIFGIRYNRVSAD